jgi:hypothetical protein
MRVRTLILAHLGLTLACKKTATAVAEDAAVAIPVATATATVSASASATASADPTPSTSASVKGVPTFAISITSKPPPGRCRNQSDCPAYQSCSPSGVATELGYCRPNVVRGRPLVVSGEAHVANGDAGEAALEEHASIAAFARTLCELMALGAPLGLLRETEEALADEIRHAAMSLERTGGTFGALPAATAPLARDVEALFRDVFRGGAIGETRAAMLAERQWLETGDPFYETIAIDEARHAALAFKTLRWLLDTHPELARVRDDEIARVSGFEDLFEFLA